MARRAAAVPPYVAGDRVVQGQNRGVVLLCTTRDGSRTMADGRPYLRVKITDGPDKGDWAWPDGWTPQLNDPGTTEPEKRCAECERVFRGHDIFCATCARTVGGVQRERAVVK